MNDSGIPHEDHWQTVKAIKLRVLEVYRAIRHSRGYARIFYLLSLLISDLASIL